MSDGPSSRSSLGTGKAENYKVLRVKLQVNVWCSRSQNSRKSLGLPSSTRRTEQSEDIGETSFLIGLVRVEDQHVFFGAQQRKCVNPERQ